MADTLNIISIICFICAAICLIIGIILFIKFDIRSIVKKLSYNKSEKKVRELRTNSNIDNSVRYEMNKINMSNLKDKNKTEKITKEINNETNVLNEDTEMLSEETSVLYSSIGKTNKLADDDNNTVILTQEEEKVDTSFKIIKDIVFINCDDYIK